MSSTATTITTSEEEGFVLPNIPNEWLDYFNHQQFMEDFDVPFDGGIPLAAVSHDTSFEDDVVYLGSDNIYNNTSQGGGSDTAAGLKVSGSAGAATAISPENSTGASNNHISQVDYLSPKAKQVKRRSRASRKTPTTLLNASIKNFRTVVQQYTGCRSSNSGFNGNGKGPITLSFGPPKNDFPGSLGYDYFNTTHENLDDHQQMINSFADY
ncbi:OLC1v1025470C1 [Oldenlandia corymbosa var. corymbosa]|uniref:OLC1v1025470C1 n=1 Tax=Oldenlandia corymbosa var. corymbosa TaxID=529605 RepID=A0AAV1C6J8_OLDCO|nr:OLC1v1025470C1 [Oldenlandia corymbosa var. corymbosa]